MTAFVLDASAILRFSVATNKDLAEGAATFKYDFKVPFVDAFAGSVALYENATLVTADYDFKFLPAK